MSSGPREQSQFEHEPATSLDRWLATEFRVQYESRRSLLEKVGLLEHLRDGSGFVGIDGKEYVIPKAEDIEYELRSYQEKYTAWFQRGFTNIEITPFGLPLEKVINTVSHKIIKHAQEGNLLSSQGPVSAIDQNEPVHVWDRLVGADVNGELRYFATSFGEGHGQSKAELLAAVQSFPGFRVYLRETNLRMLREGQGATVGGRQQIEANRSAIEYLQMFNNEGTSGLTPEDFLTMFALRLEEANMVTDELDTESGGFCVATYLQESNLSEGERCYCGVPKHDPPGHVVDVYWNNDEPQEFLQIGGGPPNVATSRIAARPVVEVGGMSAKR